MGLCSKSEFRPYRMQLEREPLLQADTLRWRLRLWMRVGRNYWPSIREHRIDEAVKECSDPLKLAGREEERLDIPFTEPFTVLARELVF